MICWCERSGNGIIRVDITADGGKSWTSANLQHHELGQKRGRCTMCIGGVLGIAVTVVCLHLPDAHGPCRFLAEQVCQRQSCICSACSEWAWTLWDVTLPLEKADRSKPLQLAVRAVDAAYNAQPEVPLKCKFLRCRAQLVLALTCHCRAMSCHVMSNHTVNNKHLDIGIEWLRLPDDTVSRAHLEPEGRALQLLAPCGAGLEE